MGSIRRRVSRVDDLITAYARRMDDHPDMDPTEHLGDLMCDLRHWAAREGVHFGGAWTLGTGNFEAELRGDDEDDPRNLEEAHPDLYAMLTEGAPLDGAGWAAVSAFLADGEPELPPDPIGPTDHQPDPPHGVIDNIYRAERVEDLVAIYAERVGLEHDEPYTQLSDFLCDIRHWAVMHAVTIASPDAPSSSSAAPWQHGTRMWVEEMLGEDCCDVAELDARLPLLTARVRGHLALPPSQAGYAPRLEPAEFLQLNRTAYWDLNPAAPTVAPPEIKPLDHELFG